MARIALAGQQAWVGSELWLVQAWLRAVRSRVSCCRSLMACGAWAARACDRELQCLSVDACLSCIGAVTVYKVLAGWQGGLHVQMWHATAQHWGMAGGRTDHSRAESLLCGLDSNPSRGFCTIACAAGTIMR